MSNMPRTSKITTFTLGRKVRIFQTMWMDSAFSHCRQLPTVILNDGLEDLRNLTISNRKYFFTTIDGCKVGSCAVAIFCCPLAFCSWSIITINKNYPISIYSAFFVNNVFNYVATFHFASAVTIYYWAVVAVDGCLVTIHSFYTVNNQSILTHVHARTSLLWLRQKIITLRAN